MRCIIQTLLLAASTCFALIGAAPLQRRPDDPGYGMQRTMRLLESAPNRPKTVRVLFYGGDLVAQDWWRLVLEKLKTQYPNAVIVCENRAVKGYDAHRLNRMAQHDVFPFYPDLLVLQLSDDFQATEELIRSTRSKTTADVLLVTSKLNGRVREATNELEFAGRMAEQYRCARCNLGAAAQDYCAEHKIAVEQLTANDGALSEKGSLCVADAVLRCFIRTPFLDDEPGKYRVSVVPIKGPDALEVATSIKFTGNRVDILPIENGWGQGIQPGHVTVDGRPPSKWHEAFFVTRPRPGPGAPLFLSRVDHDKPLLIEDWTLEVTEAAGDGSDWKFSVRGAKTGADGHGSSKEAFVSSSGRARISPEDWIKTPGLRIENGYKITWSVNGVFSDCYSPHYTRFEVRADPDNECPTTIIQGLPPGEHTLTITNGMMGRFCGARAMRVFCPPRFK